MIVTPPRGVAIKWVMLGSPFTVVLLLALLCAAPACTRERSRAVRDDELDTSIEGPRDYKEMIARARARQSPASILSDLENAIARFQVDTARLPTNLNELVGHDYIETLPTPPPGKGYVYDPIHGNVSLSETTDDSGLALPSEATNLAPVRLQDVKIPDRP